MEIILYILLLVAIMSFILLTIMFVFSFFVVFWPLIALIALAMAGYIAIRRYLYQHPKNQGAQSTIIEHREDDV